MKAVILEGNAVNPGDISWDPVTNLVDTKIYDNTTEAEKWDRLGDAQIVLANKIIMDEEVFARFPQIKYVGVCATGYNVIDLDAATRHGVVVTNIPAYSTASVVQHTMALLLDLTSKISVHDKSVKAGDWVKSETFCYWLDAPMELDGKTIGIYGFGNIGRGVAKAANALGMKVLVYTAHPEKYKEYSDVEFVSEDELFSKSDVVSLHCPLTPETNNLICKDNIAKMKDGVIIINVSRGPLVNEKDLCDALNSGKVSGAGVDVVSTEPMKEDNPLRNAKNIIITPHIAWASKEARIRLVDIASKNLEGFLNNKAINVVNQ